MPRSWTRGTELRVLALVLMLLPAAVSGQEQSREVRAYLRSVANHYRLPPGEADVLLERLTRPDELPVVLDASARTGVSPVAVVAMRRRGQPWGDILRRYGIDSRDLYVRLDSPPSLGPLGSLYARLGGASPERWRRAPLSDDALVSLVNLGFLTDYLGLPPARVAAVLSDRDSAVLAYRDLLSGRLP